MIHIWPERASAIIVVFDAGWCCAENILSISIIQRDRGWCAGHIEAVSNHLQRALIVNLWLVWGNIEFQMKHWVWLKHPPVDSCFESYYYETSSWMTFCQIYLRGRKDLLKEKTESEASLAMFVFWKVTAGFQLYWRFSKASQTSNHGFIWMHFQNYKYLFQK